MKKKHILRLLTGLGIYLVLLYILTVFEQSGQISNMGIAAWYSFVTMTTVGYGDVVPVSAEGKIIGCIFALAGTFLFAFLVGIVLTLLRGRLLPLIRLALSGKRHWYIFDDNTFGAHILGRKIQKEEPDSLVIFPGIKSDQIGDDFREEFGKKAVCTDLSTETILRKSSDRSRCTVFSMSDNGFNNYQRAASLLESGAMVNCMTEYEPDRYPVSLTLFDPVKSCARTYWKQYPIGFSEKNIILIGTGKYAESILEQALMVNVFSPDQEIRYHVFGDFVEFRRNHPFLSQICRMSENSENDNKTDNPPQKISLDRLDFLFFRNRPWNEDGELLRTADRIILCFDSDDAALSVFNTLHKSFPVSAPVHARLSRDFDDLFTFGSPDTLFTPENVLKKELDRAGRTMHNIYRKSAQSAGGNAPRWEELSAFLRRSNIASADHVPVKVRILLGEGTAADDSANYSADYSADYSEETLTAAFRKWQKEWPEKKDLFRWIEHERWLRFHLLNNWQYSEKRDNDMRLHPLIVPFELLSHEEQAKDDYAWEILGSLGEKESLGAKENQN